MSEAPSLPYAGTSGWSGSDASRERAEERDSSGKTALLQTQVQNTVTSYGYTGLTIQELRDRYPEHHHGSLSGTLTDLHKGGRILRLADKRKRCSIYVAPQFVGSREFIAPKRQFKDAHVKITPDMNPEYIGHLVIAALNKKDRVLVEYLGE